MKRRVAIALLWSLLACQAWAAQTVELWAPQFAPTGPVLLSANTAVFEDKTQQLTLEDIENSASTDLFKTTQPGPSQAKGFERSQSAVWLSLHLANRHETTAQVMLELPNPLLSYISYFESGSDASRREVHTGAALPFDTRPYKSRNFVFPVELAPLSEKTIYFRIRSDQALTAMPTLWSAEALRLHERQDYMAIALTLCAFLFLLGHALRRWLQWRQHSLLWMALTVSLFAAGLYTANGVAQELFLRPIYGNTATGYLALYCLALASLMQFLRLAVRPTVGQSPMNGLLHGASLIFFVGPVALYFNQEPLVAAIEASLLPVMTLGLIALLVTMRSRVRQWKLAMATVGILVIPGVVSQLEVLVLPPEMVILFNLVAFHWGARLMAMSEVRGGARKGIRSPDRSLEETVRERTLQLMETQRALVMAKNVAEEANRVKGNFLATVSHEIRTPLMAIAGMSYMLTQYTRDEKALNFATKIQTAANTLHAIVNDILDFSKISAHKLALEAAPFDLHALLNQTVDLIQWRAAEKGIQIATRVGSDIPVPLVGDSLRLGQILTNLLSNAVKFTPQGKVILGVDVSPTETHSVDLRFWVQDTGIGISADQLTQLFKPFSQLDVAVARQYGGSGLGLAISQNLAELMGGFITVVSTLGKGSCFEFQITLPIGSPAWEAVTALPLEAAA